MKRKAVVSLIFMIISLSWIEAQNQNPDRLNAYRIAFFTKRLKLTSQEAEKFWPVYNEFQDHRNRIQLEKATIMRTFARDESLMKEKEMTGLGDKYCEALVKESELAVNFHKKIREILPPAKVIRLYQAENQYRVQLLKELQERRPARNIPR